MQEHAAAYFAQLHSSPGVGVPETSGYPESYGQILLTNYRSLATWFWDMVAGLHALLYPKI